MKTICIMCPLGCALEVVEKDSNIVVTGNSCKRGETYGRQEMISPKRVVTSLVKLVGGGVTSVKTDGLVDKNKIFHILKELSTIQMTRPVKIGDIVIANVLETGANIVVTREVENV